MHDTVIWQAEFVFFFASSFLLEKSNSPWDNPTHQGKGIFMMLKQAFAIMTGPYGYVRANEPGAIKE